LRYWFHLALLWLVGMDLRFTLLAVPPVLPQIHRDLALDEKAVGALTAMPVLLLSVAAIGGSILIARLGARRATIVGLLIVAIAGAVRGIGPSTAMLFAMTFIMGAGVAICQPAAPTLVGQWFPQRIGLATAVYVNGILAGEAIPADLVPVILPHIGGSWEWNLAIWSLPVLITVLVFWLWVSEGELVASATSSAWWPDWHKLLTWRLGLLQAGISVLYFGLNAYIPDYFHTLGRPWLAPIAIGALNTAQLPGSFATLFVAQKLAGKPRFFLVILVAALPALVMLIAGSDWVAVTGVSILGITSAVGLTMILALPPMLTHQGDVHRLSAGMFTIAYLGSFLLTLLGGALWDATHIPATSFIPVGIGALLVAIFGATLPKRA
jgi:MFS transporter, CP family, cyanate transporter